MAVWIFWGALALCAYTYGGYLLALIAVDAVAGCTSAMRYLARSPERTGAGDLPVLPRVSVLIAAHNEVACIRQKIENTLALDYPQERLEIWIGSDGSTDGTDEIVAEYAGRGVRLSAAPRGGKVRVLNRLADLANGTLWLFTDANTMIEPDALKALVGRMTNADVGAVCGRLRLVAPQASVATESTYWKYENLLKFYESRRGAVMGANGGIYLLRRSDWQPLPPETIVDDFLVTMRVVLNNRRVSYAPEAVATEEAAPDLAAEFNRRVRISAGNFQSLQELWPLLSRLSFSGFAFWGHKMLRWSVPLFLVAALVANLSLAARPMYALLLLAQVAFYGVALASYLGKATRIPGAMTAQYFVEMNAALALGLVRQLRGLQPAAWRRTSRPVPVRP